MSENNSQTQQQVQALRTLQESYDVLATASAAGAKETSVKDGNDTAVSVGKEIADEGKWLHDGKPDWTRYFTDSVYLGKDTEPWDECTTEYMEQWKKDHPEPEEDAI